MANTDQDRIVTVLTTLISRNNWDEGDLEAYTQLDHPHRQQLMRNVFQRAQETVGEEAEGPQTFATRQNALLFANDLVDTLDSKGLQLPPDAEASARWFAATLSRRFLERDLLQRGLSFGDDITVGIINTAEAVRQQLAKIAALQGIAPETAADVAYEGAYMREMVGDYQGAYTTYRDWAYKTEAAGDKLSSDIFNLKAGKTAIDAMSRGVAIEGVTTGLILSVYENSVETLAEGHRAGNTIATQWLQRTMPDHLGQLVKLGGGLTQPVESLKTRLALTMAPAVEAPKN